VLSENSEFPQLIIREKGTDASVPSKNVTTCGCTSGRSTQERKKILIRILV